MRYLFLCLGLLILTGAAPFTSPLDPSISCQNIKNYGGISDGATDNSAALLSAVSTNSCVYFPSGTYLFSAPVAITVSSSFSIFGDGSSSIIKQTAGWTFTMSGSDNGTEDTASIHFANLDFQTPTNGTITGITLTRSDTQQNLQSSSFDHISARGSAPTNYYGTFINVYQWSVLNFNDLNIFMFNDSGTGVILQGNPAATAAGHPAAEYNFVNSSFWLGHVGISFNDYAQGLQLVNDNCTGTDYCVYATVGAGNTSRDEILISNSQFAPAIVGVYIPATDVRNITITGNYFILGNIVAAVYAAPNDIGPITMTNNTILATGGTSNLGFGVSNSTSGTSPILIKDNRWAALTGATLTGVDYESVVTNVLALDNVVGGGGGTVNPTKNLTPGVFGSYMTQSGKKVRYNTPTSCAGLSTGTEWSNLGVLSLCP